MYEELHARPAQRIEPIQLDHLPHAYPSSSSHSLLATTPPAPGCSQNDVMCAQMPYQVAASPRSLPLPQPISQPIPQPPPQPPPPQPPPPRKEPSSPSSGSSESSSASLPPPQTPRRVVRRGSNGRRGGAALQRRISDARSKDDKNDSASSSGFLNKSLTRLNISKAKGVFSSPCSSPNTLLHSDVWIIQYHDVWSRLTLSLFYKAVEERTLSPAQYTCWLIDRTSISIKVLEAATRTNEMLKCVKPGITLPLLSTAKENAEFLAQYTVLNGFDVDPNRRLSNAARKLEDILETSTAPDAGSLISAITSVWAFMFACWQAWALCKRRGRAIPPHFEPVADHLARDESISSLVETQNVLDMLLKQHRGAAGKKEFEKAGKIFHDVVTKACAVLDYTMAISDTNHIPLCTCGRKGHLPSQCTFKSHI